MKKFYRVCNINNRQGLWYDQDGNFTGLIHNEFNFCKNCTLQMPFDPDIIGYLSATDTLETLFDWFTMEDIQQLENFGFCIHEYDAVDYKFYQNHWVINQATSIVVQKIDIKKLVYEL